MVVASKGFTKLRVEFNDDLAVRSETVFPELRITGRAIAMSMKSLLQYEMRCKQGHQKETVVISYLQKLGWDIAPVYS